MRLQALGQRPSRLRFFGICGVGYNRKSLIVMNHGAKFLLGKVAFAPGPGTS